MQLKVKELRGALAERSVGWADCLEKSELASRLAGLQAHHWVDSRGRRGWCSRAGVAGRAACGRCRRV